MYVRHRGSIFMAITEWQRAREKERRGRNWTVLSFSLSLFFSSLSGRLERERERETFSDSDALIHCLIKQKILRIQGEFRIVNALDYLTLGPFSSRKDGLVTQHGPAFVSIWSIGDIDITGPLHLAGRTIDRLISPSQSFEDTQRSKWLHHSRACHYCCCCCCHHLHQFVLLSSLHKARITRQPRVVLDQPDEQTKTKAQFLIPTFFRCEESPRGKSSRWNPLIVHILSFSFWWDPLIVVCAKSFLIALVLTFHFHVAVENRPSVSWAKKGKWEFQYAEKW